MIILDTNVVSELMKSHPDAQVRTWFADQHNADLAITAMTAAELLQGALNLPRGTRRSRLVATIAEVLEHDFADRVLPFDADAALDFAEISSVRRGAGLPISAQDAIIASIARRCGASLATRNTKDFNGIGLDIVNPWAPRPDPQSRASPTVD